MTNYNSAPQPKKVHDHACEPQFIYHCPSDIFNNHDLTVNELKLYMIIRSFIDTRHEVFASNQYFADRLKVTKRTAERCVSSLIEKEIIFTYYVNRQRYLTIFKNHPAVACDANEIEPSGGPTDVSRGTDTRVEGNRHKCRSSNSKIINTNNINKKRKNIKKEKNENESHKDSEERSVTKYQETLYPMPDTARALTSNNLTTDNPHNIPAEMIKDWLTVRKNKKQPVTATAWKRLNSQLAKCSDPIEAFEIMVTHGWTSLNHDWIDNMKKNTKSSISKQVENTNWVERVNRMHAERERKAKGEI